MRSRPRGSASTRSRKPPDQRKPSQRSRKETPRGLGTPRPPAPAAGPLSYPAAKITPIKGASCRSAPAINPDERSGLEAILELCKVPVRDLAGILPYIAGHVTSAIVTVPSEYEGSRLKDHGLQFIRQDLQLAVVALRH